MRNENEESVAMNQEHHDWKPIEGKIPFANLSQCKKCGLQRLQQGDEFLYGLNGKAYAGNKDCRLLSMKRALK